MATMYTITRAFVRALRPIGTRQLRPAYSIGWRSGAIPTRYASYATATSSSPSSEAERELSSLMKDMISPRSHRYRQLELFLSYIRNSNDMTLIKPAIDHLRLQNISLEPKHAKWILETCQRIPEEGARLAYEVFGEPGVYGILSPEEIEMLMRILNEAGLHSEVLNVLVAYDEVMSLPLEVYEEFFKASENDESVYVAALHEFEAMRETGPLPSKSTYTAIIRAAQRFDDKLSLEQLLAYYNADGFRDTPEIAEIKSALMARESQESA